MVFSVKYRKEDGTLDTLEVEAESRAAVFPLLEKRGIKAIRVDDGPVKQSGWNRPKSGAASGSRSTKSGGKPSVLRGAVAGLFVVALAIVGYYYFTSAKPVPQPEEPKPTKPKSESIETVKPSVPKKPTAQPSKPQVTNEVAKKPAADERLDLTSTTNSQGEVMERWRTADGKTHARLIPPPPVFDNPIDQALSIVLSVPPGQTLPPMPSLGPKAGDQFADALKKPIEIKDTDSEAVKRAKLIVQAGREQLLDAISRGQTVNEVLAEHCAMINDNAQLRTEVGREYRKLIEEGDTEAAEQYREKANEILERAGADLVPEYNPNARQQRKGNKE